MESESQEPQVADEMCKAPAPSATGKKGPKPLPPLPNPNATIVRDLMRDSGVDGSYKDHVVVAGRRLIDWQGQYDVVSVDEEGKKDRDVVVVDGMAIVHKRHLHKIIGDEWGAKFWHRALRRRINSAPPTPPGQPPFKRAEWVEKVRKEGAAGRATRMASPDDKPEK